MAQVDFFYDQQIRRFLLQFTRIFSGFQVEYGKDDSGTVTYMTVPVRYGDASRQAQTIIANNSANSMPCAPMMSFYVNGVKYARARVQEPYHIDKIPVKQRTYNEDTDMYEKTQGNAFTVNRHMPVPYDLSIKLDIWTTNTNQKWQLFEQIVPMFNPSLEIQSTDNYLDWTSLSVIELNDINYTSRSIPNNEEMIDIMTLTFTLPIWVSMPAKVTSGGVIHKVIASMYDENGDAHAALENDDLLLGTRVKVTPHGYKVLLIGNQLQVLKSNEVSQSATDLSSLEAHDDPLLWRPVITEYGSLRDGISQIRLTNPIDDSEIIGTVAYHPSNEHVLLFTVDSDTVPTNTLRSIVSVVDPLRSGPGTGLAAAAPGQRYMLTQAIGFATDENDSSSIPPAADEWRGVNDEELIADKNDIIEYIDGKWTVVFDASENTSTEYVTNLNTNLQYRWNGTDWLRSYEGIYSGGQWSIVI